MWCTKKKSIIISLIALMFLVLSIGCSNESEPNQTTLEGRWKLEAVLLDPGDGSGEFQTMDSDKIIEFFKDGTLESNGNLCGAGGDSDRSSKGIYTLPDSILHIDDCPRPIAPTQFSIESGRLILYYPCIEACQEKYVKLD